MLRVGHKRFRGLPVGLGRTKNDSNRQYYINHFLRWVHERLELDDVAFAYLRLIQVVLLLRDRGGLSWSSLRRCLGLLNRRTLGASGSTTRWLLRRGLGATNRRSLNSSTVTNRLLDGNTLAHPLKRVLALKFSELIRSVLVEEFVDGEETTADLDGDLVTLDLNAHAL